MAFTVSTNHTVTLLYTLLLFLKRSHWFPAVYDASTSGFLCDYPGMQILRPRRACSARTCVSSEPPGESARRRPKLDERRFQPSFLRLGGRDSIYPLMQPQCLIASLTVIKIKISDVLISQLPYSFISGLALKLGKCDDVH